MTDKIEIPYAQRAEETGEKLPHPPSITCMTWQSLTVTPACALVHAQSNHTDHQDAEKDHLRDALCDLSDDLNAFGLRIPLTLLIECDTPQQQENWRTLAGNQDWHRGSFSIAPITREMIPEQFRVSPVEFFLTTPNTLLTDRLELRKQGVDDYLTRMDERLKCYQAAPGAHPLEPDFYHALIQTIRTDLKSANPQQEAQRCVEHWLDRHIAPWAHIARTMYPTSSQEKSS